MDGAVSMMEKTSGRDTDSADKELSSIKLEYSSFRESQEKELSSLSDRHAHTQLQLDSVR